MYDLEIPRAKDIMKEPALAFSAATELLTAIDALATKQAAAAPVVDENSCLLGMLTEKDCLRILSSDAFDQPRAVGRVGDYMSRISVIIGPSMDLFRVAEMFLATNFPMLPVVHEGKLAGCITRQHMLAEIQELGRLLEAQQRKIERRAEQTHRRPRSIEQMQQTAAAMSPDQLASKLGRRR
ncbi:MAG: CBS domain-containing protein [Thermoanaerobaculia bacterium]|nr:CBS domain-containing protein [Thermoanaerobaculia bacterium]